uniref:Zinc finger protein 385A n=1 Tax=Sphenodon punctatus TaxID=8508 RepID=A0A8D0GT90_SPHPU
LILAVALSRVSPIPSILRPSPAMMQPPLDLKSFLSFPMEAQPTVGLFPAFSVSLLHPLQPGRMHRGLGWSAESSEEVPGVRGPRPGGGGARNPAPCALAGPDPAGSFAHQPPGPPAPLPAPEPGARQGWGVGGALQHPELRMRTDREPWLGEESTKHKTILEARSGLGPIKAYPRLGPTAGGDPGSQDPNAQERTFHCEICNVKVNSETQLKQHISSRRHRDGVAGKPNPLLSRHKKPRGLAEFPCPLAFPKELPKSLAAGLLPSPLAMAAAMAAAASSPLALRPTPTAQLLQGPPLTHHLLRPAPGPIRTAHGPILFSPY